MFFHGFIGLTKDVFKVMTLFNNAIRNALFSFFETTKIAFVGQVNLICEKTRNRNIFIKYRFVDYVNRSYTKLFSLWARSCLIISYPLNFSTTELQRFLVTSFFPCTFFLIRNLNISLLKKFKKKIMLSKNLINNKTSVKMSKKCPI